MAAPGAADHPCTGSTECVSVAIFRPLGLGVTTPRRTRNGEVGMNERRDPFGQALAQIRQRLRLGRHVLGEQLMITELARELHLSSTPIREALSRLAGEGLIEDRRGSGYFAWRLDAVDLVELYDLQLAYLTAALRRAADPGVMELKAANGRAEAVLGSAGDEVVRSTEAVMEKVISGGRSQALSRANRLLADRLAPARRVEVRVSLPVERDLHVLRVAVAAGGDPTAAFEDYHRRRVSQAPAVIAAMRSEAGRI